MSTGYTAYAALAAAFANVPAPASRAALVAAGQAAAVIANAYIPATDAAAFDAVAADAAVAFWSAVSLDVKRVEEGATPSVIARMPLWPNSPPARLGSLWEEMKSALHAAHEDWHVWTIWYEDRLDGTIREDERELAYVRRPGGRRRRNQTAHRGA